MKNVADAGHVLMYALLLYTSLIITKSLLKMASNAVSVGHAMLNVRKRL